MKIQVVELRFSTRWPGKVPVGNGWKGFEGVGSVALRVKEHSRLEVI